MLEVEKELVFLEAFFVAPLFLDIYIEVFNTIFKTKTLS